jgi:hypothetical protein
MHIDFKRITVFGVMVPLASFLIMGLAACSSSTTPAQSAATSSTTSTGASTPAQSSNRNGFISRQGGGSSGTITAVTDNIFTMDTSQGTLVVYVSDNTSILKNVTGSLTDLQTGQFLTVNGTADASGNTAASMIMVRSQDMGSRFSPPAGVTPGQGGRPNSGGSGNRTFNGPGNGFNGPGNGNGVFGTLASIDGNTLELTTVQGQEKTVTVGPDTVIQVMESGSLADLKVGDTVTVMGNKDTSGNIDALFITLGTMPAFSGGS